MQKHFITQQFWVVPKLFWFTLNKIPRVMKLYIFLLFCSIGLAQAASSYAQNATVSLKIQNQTVQTVLDEIENQSEFSFFFNTKHVDLNRRVSIDAENSDIFRVLDRLFSGTNVKYSVVDRKIILSTEIVQIEQQKKKIVIGIVKDERGEPVIGANVIEKGTTNGTVTDMNGRYSLSVAGDAVLQISYIGYIPKDVSTINKTMLNVIIQENTQALDEVVVVGYGTQKRINLSGAVETVSAKALENRSTNNVAVALQGLVPNLNISPNGGQATAEPTFNIRGETSINGGGPLILVDGIPTSAADFSRMNSMDIESISVLKDASSAAIYGARASFGVILVTTKKGKGEKLTVQFNNNFNARTLTNMPKVVKDPYIQASYKKEMGKPWYDLYTDEELEYAQKLLLDPSLPSTIPSTLNP